MAQAQSQKTSAMSSKDSSPKTSKKVLEEPAKDPTSQTAPSVKEEVKSTDAKAPTTNEPLGPPPRPTTTGDTPDYFNTYVRGHIHMAQWSEFQRRSNSELALDPDLLDEGITREYQEQEASLNSDDGRLHNPFNNEPNPFEASFGNPSSGTPGKTILPPVANITSPAPLPGITPGWNNSLRAGPLSPAMLTGPTSQADYFSEGFRGFPTPNESSMRTGLTPGGGGSMFPAHSPNTQAIFNLQSAGVTPGTGDFQQAALRAAAQAKSNLSTTTNAPTSQPDPTSAGMDRQNNFSQLQQPQQRGQNDSYANHDVSNAANDLLSFATQNGGPRNGQQPYSMPPQQSTMNAGHMPVQPVSQDHGRHNTKGSINSMTGSADTGDFSDSNGSDNNKSNARRRGKKGGANGKQTAGTKRKADEAPKGGMRKKSAVPSIGDDDDNSDDDMMDIKNEENGGRKMTDEEKRKNFLERNRVAALKCRQRKKQWLANLQTKVELFSTENDALSATVTQLREEIVNLKTLLLAHKDCPVSQAQGLHGSAMNNFLGSDINHQNPYGMAQIQPNGVHMGMPMQPNGHNMMNRFVFPTPRATGADEQENAPYPPKY